jgi:hypothetical protein
MAPPLTGGSLIPHPPTEGERSMNKIALFTAAAAVLFATSVAAQENIGKDAKVTLVFGPGEDAANLSIEWRWEAPPLPLRPTADTASALFAILFRKSSTVRSTSHSHPAVFAAKWRFLSGHAYPIHRQRMAAPHGN